MDHDRPDRRHTDGVGLERQPRIDPRRRLGRQPGQSRRVPRLSRRPVVRRGRRRPRLAGRVRRGDRDRRRRRRVGRDRDRPVIALQPGRFAARRAGRADTHLRSQRRRLLAQPADGCMGPEHHGCGRCLLRRGAPADLDHRPDNGRADRRRAGRTDRRRSHRHHRRRGSGRDRTRRRGGARVVGERR